METAGRVMPKVGLFRFNENGRVAEVRQDVVHLTGLTNCMNGQLVALGQGSTGVILGYDPDYVLVLLVSQDGTLKPGDAARTTLNEFRVPVGESFIGRRVNALAHPLDNRGPIKESDWYPIFGRAPGVLDRIPLTDELQTGTKIIDMLKPVGKGQRMLILGDRMTGKTTLGVDAILSQKGKNVICIYCCIGKAEAAINKVVEVFNRHDVWPYAMIVAASASDTMGLQYLAPYVATSLGEYFMHEKHGDVLMVFDDLTKHAWAYRQISLLLERAPGRDAYPGDIFYIHSQLVERAGRLNREHGGGSMTHLPIVETLQGDLAGYIPSNIVSMTDGQIYMNTTLFSEGFRPAIDMGLSVSRIGSKIQWRAMKSMTGMLQLEFVRYKELEKLTRIKAGSSPDVQRRLTKGRILEEVLKQDENDPVPMENQVMILYALQHGLFENVGAASVSGRIKRWLAQVHANRPDLVQELIAKRNLTDGIKEGLNEELKRFGSAAV